MLYHARFENVHLSMHHDPSSAPVGVRTLFTLPVGRRDAGWRLCVAPMMAWTDRHCRFFHRLLSPHARLYSEMLTGAAVVHGDRAYLLHHDTRERPVALQLAGSDPAELALAARHGQRAGYDEINLNVCCPSSRVQSGGFGAVLMRDPTCTAACIRAMRDAVTVPVTAKCRIGVDDQDAYADLQRFAEAMCAAGVEVLEVHARKAWLKGLSPRQNREIPPLDYARVHRLKREFPQLTVVINGGIATVAAVEEQLHVVDGVMLGRAVYGNPWLLAQLESALWGTPLPTRGDVVRRLRPYVAVEQMRGTPFRHIARHLLGLFQGQPRARRFRRILSEGMHADAAGWPLLKRALAAVEPVAEAA